MQFVMVFDRSRRARRLHPGRARLRGAGFTAALAVAVFGSACSGSTPASSSGPDLHVFLRDFRIAASMPTVSAGTVTFVIHSKGPTTHEFVVVRTDLAANALPLRPDGITVDEDSTALHDVGEEEDIALGATTTLTLRLPPGHYVLYCNMEGHYLGGMRLGLTVP